MTVRHDKRRGSAYLWRSAAQALFASASVIVLASASAQAQDGGGEDFLAEPIVVEGDPEVVTEGKNTYVAPRVTVGGRQPQNVRDVPNTITVLTRQLIDDTGATTLEEAAYAVPGLTTATGDGFLASLYVRGQEVFQYYVDGTQRPYLSIYGTAPDLFFFDRVEVMHGPSGVFQGSGEPVGTVNLVRKRPLDERTLQLGISGDTFGGYRGELDYSTPFNESATVRGRFALVYDQGESYVDYNEMRRIGGYGTIEVDFGEDTTLSFGMIYEHVDRADFSGLPTYTDGTLINLPRETFIGVPFDASNTDTLDFFAEIEHEFDYGGVLKVTGRYFDRNAEILNVLGISGVDPATGNFNVFNFAREFEEENAYVDANLTSPFSIAGVKGEVVVGAEFRSTDQTMRQQFVFDPNVYNVFAFNPFAVPAVNITFPGVGPGFNLNALTETSEYGFYVQARAEIIDGLKLNLGGRYSGYESKVTDTGRGRISKLSETNFAPYAGLTFDVTDEVTLYASYASIFTPQTELTVDATNVEPRTGRQYEAGVKTEFFDGNLQANAAFFLIQDRNRAVDDAANVGFFVGTGKADTMGFDVQVMGSPYPGVEIAVGYTYVDTELRNDPTSPNNLVLIGKYTFAGGALDGLSIGAGMRAVDGFSIFDDSENVTIKAGGYAVFNAFASYQIQENVAIQLNVDNLFDRTYYERVNEVIRGNFYGAPLNATLHLTAKL